MKKIALVLMLLWLVIPAHASHSKPRWKEKPTWQNYFQAANVDGCFLLYDLQKDEYLSYNRERVNKGFLPASTYKILNSLIALETGAVRDEQELLRWDGVERMVPAWNRDQNMREALANSTVWFYQEMARRIGQSRMQHYVDAANYGNRNISGGIEHFWLDGGMRITAKEQIDLLVKLHRNQLPFSSRTTSTVKDMLVTERTEKYILRSKTGWAGLGNKNAPQIGWWVGYVERAATFISSR